MYMLNNTDYFIIAILIYVFSFYYCWRWMHKAYSKNGRWGDIEPTAVDVIFTIVPFFNSILAIMFLLLLSHKKQDLVEPTNKKSLKFFKIDEN